MNDGSAPCVAFRFGVAVQRGPTWDYDDQDGGLHSIGQTQVPSRQVLKEWLESANEKDPEHERQWYKEMQQKQLEDELEEKWEYRYMPENKYTEEEVRDLRAEAKIAKHRHEMAGKRAPRS